jgi:nucleotide-binding universal stress UspA family protein
LDLVAQRCGVPLHEFEGEVEAELLRALSDSSVVAGVLGARRTPAGRKPVGQTALRILEQATTPLVVVPPTAVRTSPQPFRRLLVPLEGDERSARAVADKLSPLVQAEAEVVVVHVFTEATVPPVLDRPSRDLSLWGDEFMARFCPSADRVELRTGAVGGGVLEASRDLRSDLIVLSWSQDASVGHADVIRAVLADAVVPVMLLPVD